jgi:hypothetical protein
MSTLKVATIQDTSGNNSSTPAGIASGTAKAWVNFNGTGTVAIRAGYNVSSITDNGTGHYTVNFTTAMLNTNYAVVGGGGNGATFSLITPNAGTKTTTSTAIFATASGAFSLGDPTAICIAVFAN